ncbi:MAG: hypothetical protein U1E26_04485 [Coriobacteriia bacterium]|nr:hypothetical protein [Coriobacteriia bacterium]
MFPRIKHRTRAVAGLMALLLVLALAGCGKKEADAPELGLQPGASQGSTATGDTGASATGTANPKTPSDPGAGGQAEEPGGQGTGTAGGSTGGNTGGSTGTGGSGTAPSTAPKTIRIKWWNDTQANSPKNATIEFGGKSVKPKAGKGDTLAIGPCAVGKDLKLTIYPDGPSGSKLVATFRVDASMVADSEQDAIHIEVRDDRVRVLGNPVPNFEQSFARR